MTKKEFVSMSLPYGLKVLIPESDTKGCRKTVIGTVGAVYGYEDKIDNDSDDLAGGINCGTNEDLFLAIAALRDDSDRFQWFTNDVFWIKCSQIDLKNELDNNYEEFCVADFHKATVEELIKHFSV